MKSGVAVLFAEIRTQQQHAFCFGECNQLLAVVVAGRTLANFPEANRVPGYAEGLCDLCAGQPGFTEL